MFTILPNKMLTLHIIAVQRITRTDKDVQQVASYQKKQILGNSYVQCNLQ